MVKELRGSKCLKGRLEIELRERERDKRERDTQRVVHKNDHVGVVSSREVSDNEPGTKIFKE